MRFTIGYILFFALSLNLSAQQQKISGTVVDQQTGEPLPGVTVKHLSSGLEVITDFDGHFSIQTADPGINRVEVKYVSYQEVILNRVLVQEDQHTELRIKMRKVAGAGSDRNIMAVTPGNDPRS